MKITTTNLAPHIKIARKHIAQFWPDLEYMARGLTILIDSIQHSYFNIAHVYPLKRRLKSVIVIPLSVHAGCAYTYSNLKIKSVSLFWSWSLLGRLWRKAKDHKSLIKKFLWLDGYNTHQSPEFQVLNPCLRVEFVMFLLKTKEKV
jgi:hypothetical protein